jgi:hypothetical protein
MRCDAAKTRYVRPHPTFIPIVAAQPQSNMTRKSPHHSTNDRYNPSALSQSHGSLAKEYRELQDLRERVRKAEAATAQRLIRPRGKAQRKDNEQWKAERVAREAAKSEDKKRS